MKTLGLILGLLFTVSITNAQDTDGVTVKVTVENVLNDQGVVLASLHTSDTFMKGPGLIDLNEVAKKGEITFTFENVTPGSYAIMVLHDENENNRMDFEANGMPKENYGTSSTEMMMGPPSFEASKFEVLDTDQEITIRF